MWNIVYRGDIKYGELGSADDHKGAVQFIEPNDIQCVLVRGAILMLPFMIPITLVGLHCIIDRYQSFSEIKNNATIIIGLLGIALVCCVLPGCHEVIHALCYPLNSIKEIWHAKEEGALFIYCTAHVSKKRFIWICLAPNLILGIIPFVILLCMQNFISLYFWGPAIICSYFAIIIGIGDFYNIYNAICQVPPKGIIYNNGLHSYWYEERNG